tara:strand:+ start:548 stop:742 length:195 start_codon:yes stop_codon:yes gene_type:complete
MKNNNILARGIETIYKEFGPEDALKFFRMIGISKGDSVKEIESKTEKMSREEVLALIRKNSKKK